MACVVIFFVLIQQIRKMSRSLSIARLGQLLKLDTLYSWSALIMLITGFMLWLLSSEPPGNALLNVWFNLKLGLVVGMACLSVYPSMVFLALRNGPLMTRFSISSIVLIAIWLQLLFLLGVFLSTLMFAID